MAQEKPIIFVLTCLLVGSPIAFATVCPNQEEVAPCICEYEHSQVLIKCHGINDELLARVASNLRGKEVGTFTIEHSKLGTIPHDVFKGVRLSRFEILNSTLLALTDKSEAFVGLEDHLEDLMTSGCVFKTEWDWTVLRNLKKLRLLVIVDSLHLETLRTDLMEVYVPNLEYFFLQASNISFLSDHAFESYKNINVLSLKQNKVKNIKRSMLPDPALELSWFDVSYNLIEHLPEDIFVNMPNLMSLDISYNEILFLNEKTFSPVWEKVRSLYGQGNALHCDCRMSWLLEKKSPDTFLGKCASPPELNGKKLFKLNSKDFVCYV